MDRCCALIVFSCDAVSGRKELSVIRQKTWDGSDLLLPGRLTRNENWCTFRRHEKVQIRLVLFVPLPSTHEQFLPVAAKGKRKGCSGVMWPWELPLIPSLIICYNLTFWTLHFPYEMRRMWRIYWLVLQTRVNLLGADLPEFLADV